MSTDAHEESAAVPAIPDGKARQRRRTRAAIVAATRRLLASGATPSVGEIATAADVARRTVYQHFPSLDQLLLDATIGELSEADVDAAIEAADTDGDADQRVAAMVRALCGQSAETMALGRALVRLTVSEPADAGSPSRGFRRIAWIERALVPLREEVDDAAFERLVSGLAMVVGWEALVVLQDLRGLDEQQRTDTSLWAAHALIDATLRERG
jgi:AcrR family transcriptional regulator